MFAMISTLIIFLPVAILPLALKTGFTSLELNDMGVYLESSVSLPLYRGVLVYPGGRIDSIPVKGLA